MFRHCVANSLCYYPVILQVDINKALKSLSRSVIPVPVDRPVPPRLNVSSGFRACDVCSDLRDG